MRQAREQQGEWHQGECMRRTDCSRAKRLCAWPKRAALRQPSMAHECMRCRRTWAPRPHAGGRGFTDAATAWPCASS